MKFGVNSIIQLLGLVGQAILQVQDLLPETARFWAAVTLAGIQGAVGVLAHFSNPDGSPAKEPYQRK